MPDTPAAQQAASAPASGEQGHAEYLSFKKTSESPASVSPTEEKAAPASEPETDVQEPAAEDLSEDDLKKEKTETRRRITKLLNDRAKTRAERDLLQEEVMRLKVRLEQLDKADKPAEAAAAESEGEPDIDEYYASGRYANTDELKKAFKRDHLNWAMQQARQRQEAESAMQQQKAIRKAFDESAVKLSKQHDDFDDAYSRVEKVLQGEGTPTAVTDYLVRAKDGAEIILHLGRNPARLAEIAEMDAEDAKAEIRVIRRELKAKTPKAPETETLDTPRPPKNLAARGTVPDHLTAMKQAADSNDFKAFQRAERARKQVAV
jgi:hypothetical protein